MLVIKEPFFRIFLLNSVLIILITAYDQKYEVQETIPLIR